MRSLGLIVEYNPLHNGHLHHIKKSKKLTNPDVTVAVMSAHFMQRGEPACTNKWNRTKYALQNGIDLVVELPYAFSNQSADFFATGAISLLRNLQVTHLVFGSELGDINVLTELASQMTSLDRQNVIKKNMATGLSLPASYRKENPSLSGANNTLGIQYIKAIEKLRANIKPLTIPRLASDYNEKEPTHNKITSATAIRKMINEGAPFAAYTPVQIEDDYIKLQTWEHHYPFLRHRLLTSMPVELEKIHDMIEGIENRLISAALVSSNFTDFLNAVSTKRYTRTRIGRICANVLTGTTKKMILEWDLPAGASYIRLLGFNEKGQSYLKLMKKQLKIPLYSIFTKNSHPMMRHEQKVTAAYASVYPAEWATYLIKKEFSFRPIMIRL